MVVNHHRFTMLFFTWENETGWCGSNFLWRRIQILLLIKFIYTRTPNNNSTTTKKSNNTIIIIQTFIQLINYNIQEDR